MKLHKVFFLVSLISFIIFLSLIYQRTAPKDLSFNSLPQSPLITGANKKPVGIAINSIKSWLPLYPAQIKNNHWGTTNKGISYWDEGVIPGEKGNAILYGHNWSNLLGNLDKVNPNDTIEIFYNDNTKETFTVSFKQVIEPSNISVLEESDDTRITLYTCIGFLDSQRLVVVAIN